jgi:hypothetical protein
MADPDMAYNVIQALDDLCHTSAAAAAAGQQQQLNQNQNQNLGVQFTEIVLKEKDCICTLLDFLEQHDFYMRHYTIGLLRTVLGNAAGRLQDAVLVAPNGISRLVDLLDDSREAVRNGKRYYLRV